jgi:hypothetical protein
MTSQLYAICFNATRPSELAQFWSGVLGRKIADAPDDDIAILRSDTAAFRIRFQPSQAPKVGQNQAHFDLTSASAADQQYTVARALELGGRHIDVGQRPEEGHVVLADPDGNEFCVIAAGNKFLADTGFIGALACEGSQEVGYFWSNVLKWPLVWDQDLETAIQPPNGGTKITWSGSPVAHKAGANRVYLELALPTDSDWEAEVERLMSLGATCTGESERGRVLMLDPDGNEFALRISA